MKYLYSENFKILIKELKEEKYKWKGILSSWTGRTNIIKMSILPKAIYRFNEIFIKMLMASFTEVKKKKRTPKICKGPQKTQNSQNNPAKEEQIKKHYTPWLQVIYRVMISKTVSYWHKNRQIHQCNRIRRLEINSNIYSQLIFKEEAKNIQWRKESLG